MPEFGSFSGLSLDKPLSKEELIRAVRFLVSAEYEAIDMYERIAEASPDKDIKKGIEDIITEERKHAGEFLKMVVMLDPEEAKFYQEGFKEVEDGMGKQALSKHIRTLARNVHEADYVWQKTEKGDAKTLMYKSPFTGKKFHVSPSASNGSIDENLKKKVDAGAQYIVTQMFFDNQKYFQFVEQCRDAGIKIPIIPGLKILRTENQLRSLPKTFHIDLPDELVEEVTKSPADAAEIGRR